MAAASRSSSAGAKLAPAALIGVVFMGSTITTPLYALYAKTYGFGTILLTLIYATYVVGNVSALLFFGALSDQIGRKRAGIIALAVVGLSGLAFLAASSPAWLFVGRAFSGFAVGIVAGTGTAWLVEILGEKRRADAALLSTMVNLGGLAIGPLLAGVLTDTAPAPLRLTFIAYLLMIALAGGIVAVAREPGVKRSGNVTMTPRIGVPGELRAQFAGPAITGFCTYCFVGFYAALAPSLVSQRLHQSGYTIGGAIVFELFAVATIGAFLTRRWQSRTSMLTGLAVQLPALALLVAADRLASMPLLLAASALGGVAVALGYRGGMAVVNEIAPEDAKAAIVSSFMLACFVGNSLPVIGVAVLGQALGDPVASVTIFAAIVGALALLAIGFSLYAAHEKH